MGLRTKLAGAFVVLLMGAVLAAGFVDISWTLAKMADEVVESYWRVLHASTLG